MTDQALISLDALLKSFNGQSRPALGNISAEIAAGKMTGVVGPDGAGKSTLMRLVMGLLDADSGLIRVKGFDPATQADSIHAISGYMPQKFGLYEDLTVIENMKLYADIRGLAEPARTKKFELLLKFTDLASFQKRLAGRLSGGMKQKLGLACVLLGDPEILLLDEPSVGVDPISRRELWRMVRELASDGLTVLWATAYLDEAEKCDSVILLNQGRILFDGPPNQVLERVRGRSWAISGIDGAERRSVLLSLLKEEDIIDGVIQGGDLHVITRTKAPKILDASGEGGRSGSVQGTWRQVEPSFEDAFIDLLGGGPHGDSALARRTADKPADGAVIVEARNLTKRFGDFTAVQDNTFQIRRGEIFGLLGPNGAGKSTTFKMMCGLLQPSSGLALITGLDLKKAASKARARVGYMAQNFSLYDHLSVGQNLDFFSGAYGLYGRERKEQVRLMTEIFDLRAYLDMSAGQLPLGFKQRLALACAVMHQPDVLFLDEPTSGVDPVTRREFWQHINYLATKGVTVMVTTHFMDEAEYCDRIGLIYRGLNIATGTPDDLKALARSDSLPSPTMEDTFVELIRLSDQEGQGGDGRLRAGLDRSSYENPHSPGEKRIFADNT